MADVKFLNLFPSEQVFLFNVVKARQTGKQFDDYVRLDEEHGISCLKTQHNHASYMEGYTLNRQYYDLAKIYYNHIDTPIADLGITLLLVNFASYLSRSQYFLFVHDFNCIDVIDDFEKMLRVCSNAYVKLPFDLAMDRTYGLFAIESITGTKNYTMNKFMYFSKIIENPNITIEYFIDEFVRDHNIRIVESLYTLTSFKRSNNAIDECRRLNTKTFVYNIEPIIMVDASTFTYCGQYWFSLTSSQKPTWFAVYNDRIAFKGYMTRKSETFIIETFAKLKNHIIIGIIVDEQTIYPIRVDEPRFNGNWIHTVEFFKQHRLNVIFKTGCKPSFARSYFVIDGKTQIFKYK
ncbi:gp33-like protein [Phenacoccus solenopsis nudivirus]|nr:gp33-like protein [Phenacoccus solenopsis nudivirus]